MANLKIILIFLLLGVVATTIVQNPLLTSVVLFCTGCAACYIGLRNIITKRSRTGGSSGVPIKHYSGKKAQFLSIRPIFFGLFLITTSVFYFPSTQPNISELIWKWRYLTVLVVVSIFLVTSVDLYYRFRNKNK